MHKPCSKDTNFVRCMKCKKIFQCSRHDTAILLEHIRTDHPETYRDHQSKPKSNTKTYPSDASIATKCCCCAKLNRKSTTNNTKTNQESEADTDDIECQCGCTDARNERVEECEKTKPQLANEVDVTQYSITSEILNKYPEIQCCEFCPEDPNANRVQNRRYKVNSPIATSISSMHSPQKRNLYRTSIEKWRPADGTIYCPKCGSNKRPLIKTRAERISSNKCGACCLLSCWPFCFLPCLLPGQNIEYLHCSKCQNFLGLYDRNTNCIQPNRLFANDEQPCQDKLDKGNCDKRNIDKGNCDKGDLNSDISTNPENHSKQLPSIVIDGKELHPDMVARLQKFKKLGSLAGIDLDAYTDKESTCGPNYNDSFRETHKALSVEKIHKKTNTKDYA